MNIVRLNGGIVTYEEAIISNNSQHDYVCVASADDGIC